jgi:hypothetical protein
MVMVIAASAFGGTGHDTSAAGIRFIGVYFRSSLR